MASHIGNSYKSAVMNQSPTPSNDVVAAMQNLVIESDAAVLQAPEREEKKEVRKLEAVKTLSPKFLYRACDVHWDDIHTLHLLSDQTFVSGSKDGTLCKWNDQGELVRVVLDKNGINYEQWITAATVINSDFWMSGTRDGKVILWSTAGELVKQLSPKPPVANHKSKHRNLQRVTCLSTAKNGEDLSYFIGWPTQLTEHSIEKDARLSTCQTSKNDWVYCIHPLTDKRLLVVTGAYLDIWSRPRSAWAHEGSLIKEPPLNSGGAKPFISSLTALESSPEQFGLAVFDGSVRIVDIVAQKTIWKQTEHENRVWTVENITRNVYASCADDHLIKFWDQRQGKSVATLKGHVGRVSTLLRLSDKLLVAGTCPDNVHKSKKKAELIFYDIRK